MNRRFFLQSLMVTGMLANHSARALMISGQGDAIISIYPGTGAKEIDLQLFKAYTEPMTAALASAMRKKVYAEPYRSFSLIESTISNNRTDILFVPPIVAIHAMQHGYQPLVRVRDLATGMLVKRKGEAVTSIGMTQLDSWLGAMGQNVILERQLVAPAMIQTVKTQDAVVFLLQQKVVQAGVLRTEKANKMIATGEYEAWYPLPTSPDFTVLIHDKLAASYAEIVRKTLLSLPAAAVDSLQKAIHVPVNQFIACNKQDYAALAKAIGVKL